MIPYLNKLEEEKTLLLDRTKDLTVDQYNVVPPGFNNNIIWNMGHILVVSEDLLYGNSPYRPAQTYHYYFGNIHAHSSYPDGTKDGAHTGVLKPADCSKYAKSARHFDFIGISEHNHLQARMHLASYAKGLAEATTAHQDGRFVCLYGMEYGVIKNGGHVIIYGFDP